MDVDDVVAVVGNDIVPMAWLAAEAGQGALDHAAGHWNDLDGQWKRAQHVHHLAVVYDAQEPRRGGRDDLLPRQRPAAALDERPVRLYLVGSVDVHGNRVHVVQIQDAYAQSFQAGPCSRHCSTRPRGSDPAVPQGHR